jgi:uncharacterized protein YprB with RNaseH-like and TPR domain
LSYVYCDIETDGLNPSVIWVACCKHDGVTEVICNEQDFKAYVSSKDGAKWVFHNGIGFDVPAISRTPTGQEATVSRTGETHWGSLKETTRTGLSCLQR